MSLKIIRGGLWLIYLHLLAHGVHFITVWPASVNKSIKFHLFIVNRKVNHESRSDVDSKLLIMYGFLLILHSVYTSELMYISSILWLLIPPVPILPSSFTPPHMFFFSFLSFLLPISTPLYFSHSYLLACYFWHRSGFSASVPLNLIWTQQSETVMVKGFRSGISHCKKKTALEVVLLWYITHYYYLCNYSMYKQHFLEANILNYFICAAT